MPQRSLVVMFVIMTLVAGMASCKAKKEITIQDIPAIKDHILPANDLALRRPISTLKISKVEGILIINGNRMDIRGNIAVRRDSLIVVSVIPALGYEALRIYARPDSILVINRKDKTFFLSSLSAYLERMNIPLDYVAVQAMVANEIFYYKHEKEKTEIRIEDRTDLSGKVIKIENYWHDRLTSYQEINPYENRLIPQKVVIEDYKVRTKAMLTYRKFSYAQDQLFPMSAELMLLSGDNTLELKLEFGKVVFGEYINATFKVPGNYTRTVI
jgi:hypothetical protein